MKTFLFLIIVAIIGAGAWYYFKDYQFRKPGITDTVTSTDTLIVVKDSIINAKGFDTIPSGFYQGMLPCKTCEGIQRTIIFSGDNQFKMEELNWGKETLSRRTSGTWEKERGKFVLYRDRKIVAEYKLVKDSLINIANNGVVIPDSLSRQYVLFKKNIAPENTAWNKRKTEGIDIIGNGNDPFWSIEIDNEKLVLFKFSATEKPVIFPVEKPVITKDSTVYSVGTLPGEILKISISSRFCNDGVSDHLYEYKMTAWYKGQIYKGCAAVLNAGSLD